MIRWTRRARARANVVLVVALSSSLLVLPAGHTARAERIVFARFGERPGLYSISPDGTGLKRLTNRADSSPVWSPDGTKIAFNRWQEKNRRYLLFVARADGSQQRRFAYDSGGPPAIAWSPDGTHLAYQTFTSSQTWAVTVVELAIRTKWVIDGATSPAWSPAGDRIAFSAPRSDHSECGREVFTAAPDGSDWVQVTDDAFADDSVPVWSPNGGRIAFVSSRDHDHARDPEDCEAVAGDHLAEEIYVAPAEGGAATRLTKGFTYKHTPAWSPDGSRISYVASCSIDYCDDGGYPHDTEVFVVGADGEGRRKKLTDTRRWAEEGPVWSPDGSRIVYTATNQRDAHIETVNVRTGKRTSLVDSPGRDFQPHWRP